VGFVPSTKVDLNLKVPKMSTDDRVPRPWSDRVFSEIFDLVSNLPILMTVNLGYGPANSEEFLDWIKKRDFVIDPQAICLLRQIEPVKKSGAEEEIDLVLVSSAGLGFNLGEKLGVIYDRASRFGLRLCPDDIVSLVLWQMFSLGRRGDWCQFATNPHSDDTGKEGLLYLSRDYRDRLHISVHGGGLQTHHSRDCRFVFVRSRKKS